MLKIPKERFAVSANMNFALLGLQTLVSMSEIRSGHNGGAIRRGSAAGECSRRSGRISLAVNPLPALGASTNTMR